MAKLILEALVRYGEGVIKIRENEMDEANIKHGRDEKCIQNFGRKTKEKRRLVRTTYGWKDNVNMDLR
jgi:hypothetical protein